MILQNLKAHSGRVRFLSSIRAKVSAILLTLGMVSAFTGLFVMLAFNRVNQDMNELVGLSLPALERSALLSESASSISDAAIAVLVANDMDIATAESLVTQGMSDINTAVGRLTPDERGTLQQNVDVVEVALANLIAARKRTFESRDRIEDQSTALRDASIRIRGALAELADDAYFNLAIGGDETIATIDETLTNLVETDFAQLQLVLSAQSEINLMSGTVLAATAETDPATKSILADIYMAADAHLKSILRSLQANPGNEIDMVAVLDAHDVFGQAMSAGIHGLNNARAELLRARQQADAALSSAVDDMVFAVTIASDDASTANDTAIRKLLDEQVGSLNMLLDINSHISEFQVGILDVLSAEGEQEALTAAEPLARTAQALGKYTQTADGALAEDIALIIELADPEHGLAAFRNAAIRAERLANTAATEAGRAVESIVSRAKELDAVSQVSIGNMARTVFNEVSRARFTVYVAMTISALVLIFSLILSRRLIQAPLTAVSEATERLAGGDLSPIDQSAGTSDEIQRIATALAVFRDGLVERAELEKRAETERQTAEAERRTNQERQTVAVQAVGRGLSELAGGDLTTRIKMQMPGGYGQLRDDFNSALATLMGTVTEVLDSVLSIRGGSLETSRTADNIAQRMESQAATLEQTAAALDAMTTNARHTAMDARKVEEAAKTARAITQDGSEVVNDAVTAMSTIESGSKHISQIVGVIEDIAFQTNLLALNAGVEAARAGETGRGFAVVASEVRALAQRSSEAALEIKTLIQNSADQVEKGAVLVNKAGETLQIILGQVREISQLVDGITERIADQSTGLEEINTSMGHLDEVTQQNVALVEEATAASQLLSNDANKLAELTARFRIAEESAPRKSASENMPHGFAQAG